MDIVDAQVHVGRGMIAPTLEAMDALGITSVLIDEFWGVWRGSHPSHIEPGWLMENGAWRAAWPTAEEAGILHPERFSYIVRVDPRDTHLDSLMHVIASSPNARAVRVQPVWTQAEAEAFTAGAYDRTFAIAQDLGLPVCIFAPGYAEALAPILGRYPDLTFVLDHCGMGYPNIPPDRPNVEALRTLEPAYFDKVLKLAQFPNLTLKWAHAQRAFAADRYPYEPARPFLRRAIDAFGADRLIWASDKTVMFGHRWADLLFAVREAPDLTTEEKSWVLGGTARRVFAWPAPVPPEASSREIERTTR